MAPRGSHAFDLAGVAAIVAAAPLSILGVLLDAPEGRIAAFGLVMLGAALAVPRWMEVLGGVRPVFSLRRRARPPAKVPTPGVRVRFVGAPMSVLLGSGGSLSKDDQRLVIEGWRAPRAALPFAVALGAALLPSGGPIAGAVGGLALFCLLVRRARYEARIDEILEVDLYRVPPRLRFPKDVLPVEELALHADAARFRQLERLVAGFPNVLAAGAPRPEEGQDPDPADEGVLEHLWARSRHRPTAIAALALVASVALLGLARSLPRVDVDPPPLIPLGALVAAWGLAFWSQRGARRGARRRITAGDVPVRFRGDDESPFGAGRGHVRVCEDGLLFRSESPSWWDWVFLAGAAAAIWRGAAVPIAVAPAAPAAAWVWLAIGIFGVFGLPRSRVVTARVPFGDIAAARVTGTRHELDVESGRPLDTIRFEVGSAGLRARLAAVLGERLVDRPPERPSPPSPSPSRRPPPRPPTLVDLDERLARLRDLS